MGAIIVPSPAEIRRQLKFLWKEDPAFFWCPDEPKNFLRDQAKGVIAIPQDGAAASFGGIANPLVATRRELYFPTSAGITSETDSYLGVALVSVPDPAAVRGCFIKIGSPSNGWGFGAGGTSFDTSGTKGIALREGVAWIDSGPANYFVRGLNVLLFGRTSDDVVTMLNWSNGSVDTSAATNTDLSPSAEIHINGYDAGGGYYRGSSEIVHAVVLIKRAMNNSQFSTLRDQVIGPRLSAFAAATPKRLNARELFKPTAKILYFPSAGGGATSTGDSGSYTLTGTAATLKVGRKLTADSGTYSLTGTDVAFKRGYALSAESGTYTVSGTAVDLKAGRKLTADSGSYTLTGTDVTLNYSPAGSYNLTAESGTYTLTGTAATLKVSRKLTADSGAYTLTGTDVTLSKGVKLTADSGSYTLSGSNVAFARTYVLTAESGAYTLTGTSAGLTWSGAPVVEAPTNGGPSIYGKPVFREKQFRKEYEEQVKRIEDEKRLARILREDEEITVIMALMAA